MHYSQNMDDRLSKFKQMSKSSQVVNSEKQIKYDQAHPQRIDLPPTKQRMAQKRETEKQVYGFTGKSNLLQEEGQDFNNGRVKALAVERLENKRDAHMAEIHQQYRFPKFREKYYTQQAQEEMVKQKIVSFAQQTAQKNVKLSQEQLITQS